MERIRHNDKTTFYVEKASFQTEENGEKTKCYENMECLSFIILQMVAKTVHGNGLITKYHHTVYLNVQKTLLEISM